MTKIEKPLGRKSRSVLPPPEHIELAVDADLDTIWKTTGPGSNKSPRETITIGTAIHVNNKQEAGEDTEPSAN